MEDLRNVTVTGDVHNISYGNRPLLILSNMVVNDSRRLDGLAQLRLSRRYVNVVYSLRRGQRLKFKGNIYSWRQSVLKYRKSVDFSRIYGIKRYGYINYLDVRKNAVWNAGYSYSYKGLLDYVRSSIIRRVMHSDYSKDGAALVLALTVGTTGYMSAKDLHNVRRSGFAHLLAISGLHMGVIIGTAFMLIRLLLIRIQWCNLHCDVKKVSAICAVLLGLCYMGITNLSVSVMRSFIMFIVSMLSILFDKKATSIRSWCFAATVIAAFMPEKVFTPSFQLSFMASLALIVLYQRSHSQYIAVPELLGYRYSILKYLAAIFWSSNMATVATLFFEIYHFKKYTVMGLLSNALAIPIAEFCMLPLCVLGIILMPLRLEYFCLWLASKCGQLLCALAAYFANIDWGWFSVSTMPNSSILLYSVGLVLIFAFWDIWQCRIMAVALALLAMCLHWLY